jgi:hypothetical protein
MRDVTLPASMVPDVLAALATVALHYRTRAKHHKTEFDKLLNEDAPEDQLEAVEAELVESEDALDRYNAAHTFIMNGAGITHES